MAMITVHSERVCYLCGRRRLCSETDSGVPVCADCRARFLEERAD